MAIGASLWEAGHGTVVGGIRASGSVAKAPRAPLSREVAWEELVGPGAESWLLP